MEGLVELLWKRKRKELSIFINVAEVSWRERKGLCDVCRVVCRVVVFVS